MPDISWDQFETAADDILEPECTRIARAHHPTIGQFQQVSMIGREFYATKLAPLSGSSRLTKTAQSLYQILCPLITLGARTDALRHVKILAQTGTGNNTDRMGRISRISRMSPMRPLLPVGDGRLSIPSKGALPSLHGGRNGISVLRPAADA